MPVPSPGDLTQAAAATIFRVDGQPEREAILRSAFFLLFQVAAITGPARAESFDLLSPTRVAEIRHQDAAAARTSRRIVRAPLLVPPRDVGCADMFRSDELRIWSTTSQATWHLLPPKLLGPAAAVHLVEAQ